MEAQKSPFPGIPPHLHQARSRVRTWFIESKGPVGMFNQVELGAQVSGAVATYISEHVYNLMRARFPLAVRYLFIHDFSGASGYDTAARQILTQWALRVRHQIENVIVITPPMNSVFHMGVHTAAMMLRLSGIPFEAVQSLDEAQERYGLKPHEETP